LFPDVEDDSIRMCKAGLYCRSFPVTIGDSYKLIFLVGHRRMIGRDDESKVRLHKTFHEYDINDRQRRMEFLSLFDKVPIAAESEFYNPLFNHLYIIGDYLKRENDLVMKEKDNIIKIKSLTANLAHQLLLPIQTLIGKSWYLKKDIDSLGNSGIQAQATDVLNELKRLSYFAENLRTLVKIESDEKYEFKKINIFNIFRDAINLFDDEAKMKFVEINPLIIEHETFNFIEGSEIHLRAMVYNLIHNAVKYSFYGTQKRNEYVKISCKGRNNGYEFEIVNYGTGILEDEIRTGKIFQEGYRGELSKDRERIGSGLGLWVAKKIIDSHMGSIEISSYPIGDYFEVNKSLNDKKLLYKSKHKNCVKVYLPYVQRRKSDEENIVD